MAKTQHFNVICVAADTEYEVPLIRTNTVRRIGLHFRAAAAGKYGWVKKSVNTASPVGPYFTLDAGVTRDIELEDGNVQLFVASPTLGAVLEVEVIYN